MIDTVNKCVVIEPSDPGLAPLTVVFPAGTVLVGGEPPTVVLADGRELDNGDNLTIGGGAQSGENLALIDYLDHINVPESCWGTEDPDLREVWVANLGSHAFVVGP